MTSDTTATTSVQPIRETIESIVVAFILAFLFRAFVAEAFVIPTGSMAPTLMGAHKDLTCDQCGSQYQVGASLEYYNDSGTPNGTHVVGSTSSICRAINPIDFADPNEETFSGDRILVSKFDYVFSKPKRWDVIVFKPPDESRQNYIKRLIGLPGEDVLIREGDIYVKEHTQNEYQIARKPPHKILVVRQPVADTDRSVPVLLKNNYPSLWQPWSRDAQAPQWKSEQSGDGWNARLEATPNESWLRYYHKVVSPEQWIAMEQSKPLPLIEPTDSQLITDYLAYNSAFSRYRPTGIKENLAVDELVRRQSQFVFGHFGNQPVIRDKEGMEIIEENGLHWVGDLIGEYDVAIESDSGKLLMQLIEFGIEYNLSIDVANGKASLTAVDASKQQPTQLPGYFGGQTHLEGQTRIAGAGSHQLTLANVDDQIVLWVDGRVIQWTYPAEFDSRSVRSEAERRPYWTTQHPLDAAPVAIGGQGISLKVNRARVYRDLYYIAYLGDLLSDYSRADLLDLQTRGSDGSSPSPGSSYGFLQQVYSTPETWDKTQLFARRHQRAFRLEDGQYFPMGDNSAQSSDARMWRQHYVEERYLLGKALLVFWPHPWNRPIPFLPNFSRMRLIR